jgi:glycine/D-amino acid oxidase-like deaminating enzyme
MARRVAVLGAGLIGVSTAWRLAERGNQVVLVDAHYPGDGTSGTSFAWLNANNKQPRDYFELNLAGMAAHRRLRAEYPPAPWLHLNGHLQWAADNAQQEALSKKIERLRSWRYPVVDVSRAQAQQLEPDLVLDDAREAIAFFPDEGFVYPRVLVGNLLRLAVASGVVCRFAQEVIAFESSGNSLCTARLSGGEHVQADVFVLAAGRWTEQVARLAGARVPLVAAQRGSPTLGFLGFTWPLTASISRVVSTPDLNLRPDGGGRLVLQALDLDPQADLAAPPAMESPIRGELVRRLTRYVRGVDSAQLDALRIGVRPMPEDGLPAIGWTPEVQNLYVIVTHSGVTLAPLLGQLAADEVTSGRDAPDLAAYRPGRLVGSRSRGWERSE